ncbi:hypothetical protein F4801DRAFT_579398 [Xylaria longipes]|nr:hypothetical protein F4801DRAFT_579398 [Xylaria longipes]
MSETGRQIAGGAARLLSWMRWLEEKTEGTDTNVFKRTLLLANLEQFCRALEDVDVGGAELQEGRDQLARGMAELEQGREKLRADNEALADRMRALEAFDMGLESRRSELEAREREIERTVAAQAEESARLDEKSKLMDGQMMSVERGFHDLKLSMGSSFETLGGVQRDLMEEFHSRTEDQRRREEEDHRRCEEERKTDSATMAGGLSQIYDGVVDLAQEQMALKQEMLAKMESFADDWIIQRPELDMEIKQLIKERDSALFDVSVGKFELKLAKEGTDRQARKLEEMADGREKGLEQVAAFGRKVHMLQPKAEQLDQIRGMLVEMLGADPGPAEEVSAVQLIDDMMTERQKSAEEMERLKKQVDQLTGQVFESRRDDMGEVMRRTDVLDESRSSVKRKANGVQPGAAPKRLRQSTAVEWRTKIDALSSFMMANTPVPDPDGSVSELRAMHLILGAAADLSMLEQLNQWLDEAEEGQWYCFDEVVLWSISADAEIDGNGCFRHHSSAKHEDCYQIRKGVRGEDALGRDSIVCRLRQGPE